jgi:MFS family permease
MGIYLTEIGWKDFAGKLTLAQVSDVIFLFLLPVMLKRLGYKLTLAMGIMAWSVRYFLLAGSVGSVELATFMIFSAILLHGICYDFLFIAGQLYVDGESNERIRGAAQGFIAFILWGVGAFVGTSLAGVVLGNYELTDSSGVVTHEWEAIWSLPAWSAVIVLAVFLLCFREPRKAAEP